MYYLTENTSFRQNAFRFHFRKNSLVVFRLWASSKLIKLDFDLERRKCAEVKFRKPIFCVKIYDRSLPAEICSFRAFFFIYYV